jgi:hypothetical protein
VAFVVYMVMVALIWISTALGCGRKYLHGLGFVLRFYGTPLAAVPPVQNDPQNPPHILPLQNPPLQVAAIQRLPARNSPLQTENTYGMTIHNVTIHNAPPQNASLQNGPLQGVPPRNVPPQNMPPRNAPPRNALPQDLAGHTMKLAERNPDGQLGTMQDFTSGKSNCATWGGAAASRIEPSSRTVHRSNGPSGTHSHRAIQTDTAASQVVKQSLRSDTRTGQTSGTTQ